MNASDNAEVNKFKVPKDTLGLHILYDPKEATLGFAADVVAVHELGGDSFSTWSDKSSGTLWLKDFLPDSEYFHNSRILTFGYDARPWLRPGGSPATRGRSFTFSESLLNALRSKRILKHTLGRQIIFIGHSLGGIVIKNALVLAQAKQTLYGDIYESAKSISFFGTPHQGANVAEWTSYLERISKVVGVSRSNVLKELETWSPTLLNLSRTFNEQIPRLLLNSFYEKEPYKGVYVVNEGSATLSYFSEVFVGLDANHRTICKFSSKDSSVYREVLSQLETRMYEIQNAAQSVSVRKSVSELTDTESYGKETNPGLAGLPDAPATDIGTDSSSVAKSDNQGESVKLEDLESLERRMKCLKK